MKTVKNGGVSGPDSQEVRDGIELLEIMARGRWWGGVQAMAEGIRDSEVIRARVKRPKQELIRAGPCKIAMTGPDYDLNRTEIV